MRVSVFFLLLAFLATPAVSQSSPQQQVEHMVDGILIVLNSSADLKSKKAQVSGMMQKYLGVRSLSQRTLGVYWKQVSDADRVKFQKLYVRILERTYLNRIGDYSGGKVEYDQERIKKNKAILDTRFVTDKVEVPVQYKLILKGDIWQIYDIKIEGVSLIRSYRSSYNEIIRKDGIDGLFSRMEKKLAESASLGEG